MERTGKAQTTCLPGARAGLGRSHRTGVEPLRRHPAGPFNAVVPASVVAIQRLPAQRPFASDARTNREDGRARTTAERTRAGVCRSPRRSAHRTSRAARRAGSPEGRLRASRTRPKGGANPGLKTLPWSLHSLPCCVTCRLIPAESDEPRACERDSQTPYAKARRDNPVNDASRWTMAEEDHGNQPNPETTPVSAGSAVQNGTGRRPGCTLAISGQADGPSCLRRPQGRHSRTSTSGNGVGVGSLRRGISAG